MHDCDPARLNGRFELFVATRLSYFIPAVLLQPPDHLSTVHAEPLIDKNIIHIEYTLSIAKIQPLFLFSQVIGNIGAL